MSRHDLTRVEGVIADVLAAGSFAVHLKNGESINARISGRLRRLHVKIMVGDRVMVGVSPYDITHGLIMSSGSLLPKQAS